jgi:hypothetical protein
VLLKSVLSLLTFSQSLDEFADELTKALAVSLERYIDTVHGTAATIMQSTEVVRSSIEDINPPRDSE